MPKVSIEIAGLAMAVQPKSGSPYILLPDARAAGGPEHSAVLLVEDHSGLIGAPDFAVTSAGDDTEFAGYFLRGDVIVEGNEKPEADFTNVMELREIADASRLLPPEQLPITARVRLDNCKLSGHGSVAKLDFVYMEAGNAKYVYGGKDKPDFRPRVARGNVSLGTIAKLFKITFSSIDGARRVVTIDATNLKKDIVISNLTAGVAQGTPHFGTYYELMSDVKRRPRPEREGLAQQHHSRQMTAVGHLDDFPDNPDECRFGYFAE